MSIWHELENACATLKHQPEKLDPHETRQLLRKTQHIIDALTPLLQPQTMTIQQKENDGYIDYQITITTEMNKEQYLTLLETITNH
jgi:hypothetical protein